MGNEVKIKCPSTFCLRDATISKGKRRLTIKCPNCGPLNFQTKTGQESLKKYMLERGVSFTDKSSESEAGRVSETPTKQGGSSPVKSDSNKGSECTDKPTDKKPEKKGFSLWGFSV